MRHLTEEHGEVLKNFFDYPDGHIVEWPRDKDIWFYHPEEGDEQKQMANFSLNHTVCSDLVIEKIIVPDLDDIEYQAQVAVGSADARVYRMPESIKKILKKDFIDYLKTSSIVWM